MTTFGSGMTPAAFYNGLNYSPRVFNVKEYGAICDGTTDDTTALQDAINACDAAGGGTVFIPNHMRISGALQRDVGEDHYDPKSQIYIPFRSINDVGRSTIKILGAVQPSSTQGSSIINFPTSTAGTIIISDLISDVSESFVFASLGTYDSYATFNYNGIIFENLMVKVAVNGSAQATLGGFDLRAGANNTFNNVLVVPNHDINTIGQPINNCIGIAMGYQNCAGTQIINNCVVGGMNTGFICSDHSTAYNCMAILCYYGWEFGRALQQITGIRLKGQWSKYDINVTGSCYANILTYQGESSSFGHWYDNTYTINDPDNYLSGIINYAVVEGGVGINNTKFTLNGGEHLRANPIRLLKTDFTVTGSKGSNAALTSLIAKLVAQGIIVDSTT